MSLMHSLLHFLKLFLKGLCNELGFQDILYYEEDILFPLDKNVLLSEMNTQEYGRQYYDDIPGNLKSYLTFWNQGIFWRKSYLF